MNKTYLALITASILGLNVNLAHAASKGTYRCVGGAGPLSQVGDTGDHTLTLFVEHYNPNTTAQTITKVLVKQADGTTFSNSGVVALPVAGRGATVPLQGFVAPTNYGNFQVIVSWTQTDESRRAPVPQGWGLLTDANGSFLGSAPLECRGF